MPRRGYHHGDLKAALIDAALGLIRETGLNGFSLAEAARRAGVSPAAPYRHFKDREELLAATAQQGFERFAKALNAAWNGGTPSALSAFDALGRAYLRFAAERPADFAVMFDADVMARATPDLKAVAERSFDVILRACAALADRAPADRRPPAHMMAYHIWALSHGVAALFARPGGLAAPITAEEMLESGVGIYLRGLGLLDG